MAFLTGCLILDAPASALNNRGKDPSASNDNVVVVKQIRVGKDSFPYVSAQAFRYWLRTSLETQEEAWEAAPVAKVAKAAYTDANPIRWWDDDLFGYMRAPSKAKDTKKPEGEESVLPTPLEKDTEITRISPFRVGTFVGISPGGIVSDFGTMTRQNDMPAPFEHEFYRSHLQGIISLDLAATGTFFATKRVGYKNLDEVRRKEAEAEKLEQVTIRKQNAYRLPLTKRQSRASTLVRGLAHLAGGAKQTLHLTDLTPAVAILAVTKHGNNPFGRWFGPAGEARVTATRFQANAFKETTEWLHSQDELLSPIYVGWAEGFLDSEREGFRESAKASALTIKEGYPPALIQQLAATLASPESASWYD